MNDFHTRQHKDLNKPIPEIRKNDLRHATVKRSSTATPTGLVVGTRNKNKKEFYIKEVGGLFHKIHGDRVRVGDQVVLINDKSVEEFNSLWDMNDYLKKELQITISIYRDGLHLQQKKVWDKAEYNQK
tara:strand:+ start:118 stop:501 length:384 start_codon:yes stop_codon:yes gene_type:complete